MKKFLALAVLLASCQTIPPQPKQSLGSYLTSGQWESALAVLDTWSDPQSAFEKGFLLTLLALEEFYQDLERYGAGRRLQADGTYSKSYSPFSRNLDPEPLTYEKFRRLFEDFHDRLKVASESLSRGGRGDWKVRVSPADIVFDLNGDGLRTREESAGNVFFFVMNRGRADTSDFFFNTDPADSLWLAGYTKLVESFLDVGLAYDLRPLYEAGARYIFPNCVDVGTEEPRFETLSFPASFPLRGEEARQGFLRVAELGHRTWSLVVAETDDDHEWLPSPAQTSLLGLPVTAERVVEWRRVLEDFTALLEGRVYLPVEDRGGLGFNVKRFLQNLPSLQVNGVREALMAYVEQVPGDRVLGKERSLWSYLSGRGLLYAAWFN